MHKRPGRTAAGNVANAAPSPGGRTRNTPSPARGPPPAAVAAAAEYTALVIFGTPLLCSSMVTSTLPTGVAAQLLWLPGEIVTVVTDVIAAGLLLR
jgi:hypothetical protein